MPDYYEVLQVSPRAEADVIRAAYRTLARKYHPDHGGDARRMIALNDAWDVLGDPARRADYDASRTGAESQPAPTAQSPLAAPHRPRPPPNPRAEHRDRRTRPMQAHRPAIRPGPSWTSAGTPAGPWARSPVTTWSTWSGCSGRPSARKLRAEIDALLRQRAPASGRPTSDRQWNRRR